MTIRERYHVAMGEFYGKLAARCLVNTAKHSTAIDDDLTTDRVLIILHAGVESGWDNTNPTNRITPNRKDLHVRT